MRCANNGLRSWLLVVMVLVMMLIVMVLVVMLLRSWSRVVIMVLRIVVLRHYTDRCQANHKKEKILFHCCEYLEVIFRIFFKSAAKVVKKNDIHKPLGKILSNRTFFVEWYPSEG